MMMMMMMMLMMMMVMDGGVGGIIKRRGLGKTRHIDTGYLWIQQTAAEKRLKFGKVLGRDNPADMYTKYLDWDTIRRHSERVSADFVDGRASTAPELHTLRALWESELSHDDDDWTTCCMP